LVDLKTAPPTYVADSMGNLYTVLCGGGVVSDSPRDPSTLWRRPVFRIQGMYQEREMLAEGSGGKVFDALNVVTGEEIVIKIDIAEELIHKDCTLRYEAQVYRILQGHRGVLYPRWSGDVGYEEDAYAIVFEKLSPNLAQLSRFCRGRLSLKTVCMLALQLLATIEFIHSRGLIVRDVKPENCATGIDVNYSIVYIFDFGLAKLYTDPSTGTHIPYREGLVGIGSARYASYNAHFGREVSRRDDLEALGNSLLYLFHGRLPWQGIYAPSVKAKMDRIGEMKAGKPFRDLLGRSPPEFAAYFCHCRSLSFEARPDYAFLRQQFINRMEAEGWENDCKFDWIDPEQLEDGTLLPGEYRWVEWPALYSER